MTERLELAEDRLSAIPEETLVPEPFRDFFCSTAEFLLLALKGRQADNRQLFEDILPGHYHRSYGNPEYAASKLGKKYGLYFSAVYAELREIIPCVFERKDDQISALLELFLELYFAFSDEEIPDAETVRHIFASYVQDYQYEHINSRLQESLDPSLSFASDIIKKADLSNTDYLFDFGEYISDSARETAAYLNSLPEAKVEAMAATVMTGFLTGFEKAGKSLNGKKNVQIRFRLGFERMIRSLIGMFEAKGFSCILVRATQYLSEKNGSRRSGWYGDIPNPQFDYDHRNDIALVLDKNYVSSRLRYLQECYDTCSDMADCFAGPIWIDTFGEETFIPEKSLSVSLSGEKEKLLVSMRSSAGQIVKRYLPGNETSFCIISYPIPDIGPDFRNIFEETIQINTMSSSDYEKIQQYLVDALDRGYAAHILGQGENRTDLTVRFHELSNPEKESNFENCTADVNIPVGEVFTSPRLNGTGGLLFVENACLEGLTFRNLFLRFKDGMTVDYGCSNYDDRDENRRLIEDNILFHHDSLPMGEFAIGTNTRAYRMGRIFNIQEKLPILIAEKTGPHFAVGDTCYSYEEDEKTYNPDGKEISARENEVSALRRSDPDKAYFGCHTDITLPYDELGLIEVLTNDGRRIPLLQNGRFVLAGTEILNEPLEQL